MKIDLIGLLRCPVTGQFLNLETEDACSQEYIKTGWLVSEDRQHRYPIQNHIPRFVPESNYADNFGMQWNIFSKTQLDSHSGLSISADRFWAATGWLPQELRGQWVLDVGCGSGRFAEVALKAGAKVVALDYSSAIDACYENLKNHDNLYVIQGDVYSLPLAPGSFSYVYSLGVLQHTPDVGAAFSALPLMLARGGFLCADFYWNRFRTLLHPKYLLRPFTTRMSQVKLFSWLKKNVPILLRLSQFLGRVPVVGCLLKRIVPVADYTGIYPLSQQQLHEWALLDTFDMLAPAYDNPQSAAKVREWFKLAGLEDIRVFHSGHLVGRGRAR
jgi:SAM-dependent methyltransferase